MQRGHTLDRPDLVFLRASSYCEVAASTTLEVRIPNWACTGRACGAEMNGMLPFSTSTDQLVLISILLSKMTGIKS